MFVRTKTTQGRTYLQVVENYREGAKVRQKVIATLGRKEELQASGQIEGVLKSLSRFSDKVRVTEEFREGKLEAKRVQKIGPDLITGRLWSELGCDVAIGKLLSGRKYSFSVERALYAATLARLFFPGSDRYADRKAGICASPNRRSSPCTNSAGPWPFWGRRGRGLKSRGSDWRGL